jgi:hypothetical protein
MSSTYSMHSSYAALFTAVHTITVRTQDESRRHRYSIDLSTNDHNNNAARGCTINRIRRRWSLIHFMWYSRRIDSRERSETHQERTFVAKMELTLLSRWLCKKTQWTRTPYQHEHASPARPTISWPSTTVIVRRRHGLVTPICRLDFLMTDIRGVRGLT